MAGGRVVGSWAAGRAPKALVIGVCIAGSFAACSQLLNDGGLSGGVADAAGMDATALELVDCYDPIASADERCRTIDSLPPGSVGGGLTPTWLSATTGLPTLRVMGGVVSGGRLLLGVTRPGPEAEGGVIAIDLQTGERSLLAGMVRTASGVASRGQGNGFADLVSIGVSPGGALFAHLWPEFGGFSGFMLDIDSQTGNRTTRSVGGKCDQVLPTDLFKTFGVGQGLGADSTAYIVGTSAQGDALIRVQGDQCELLTRLPDQGAPNVQVVHAAEGKLFYVDSYGSWLDSFDLQSGRIEHVATPSAKDPFLEPTPVGVDGMAVTADRIWTAGSHGGLLDGNFLLTEVDRGSGARLPHRGDAGPARTQPVTPQHVWIRPGGGLLLSIDGAVVVYDPVTDNSNVLSY